MGPIKKLFTYMLALLLFIGAGSGAWSFFLTVHYGKKIYTDLKEVPRTQAALVLGASVQQNKTPSPILMRRLDHAAELYHALKVEKLLLSGAHDDRYYNETAVMKNYLEKKKNIPSKDILLDPRGDRTLDSVYHSSKLYKFKSITIVTQRFHLYRALFLATHFGIDAFGYSPNLEEEITFALRFREFFAQGLAFIDAWLLNTTPEIR